jgi:hypothetical protein
MGTVSKAQEKSGGRENRPER